MRVILPLRQQQQQQQKEQKEQNTNQAIPKGLQSSSSPLGIEIQESGVVDSQTQADADTITIDECTNNFICKTLNTFEAGVVKSGESNTINTGIHTNQSSTSSDNTAKNILSSRSKPSIGAINHLKQSYEQQPQEQQGIQVNHNQSYQSIACDTCHSTKSQQILSQSSNDTNNFKCSLNQTSTEGTNKQEKKRKIVNCNTLNNLSTSLSSSSYCTTNHSYNCEKTSSAKKQKSIETCNRTSIKLPMQLHDNNSHYYYYSDTHNNNNNKMPQLKSKEDDRDNHSYHNNQPTSLLQLQPVQEEEQQQRQNFVDNTCNNDNPADDNDDNHNCNDDNYIVHQSYVNNVIHFSEQKYNKPVYQTNASLASKSSSVAAAGATTTKPLTLRNQSNAASIHPIGNKDNTINTSHTDTLREFEAALKSRGLELVEQEGDGNCLFRAVSFQVYGDANAHLDVRKRCMDFMAKDEGHFSQFVDNEPFHDYISRKRRNGVHGNNPEIQAISELYNRPVEIFVPENGADPINIFHADYKTCDTPIRLSYHDGEHYNAVIDPLLPTAGLGLGLPGLEPGLADRLQIKQAVDESDKLHVQKIADEAYEMDMQRVLMESKMNYIQETEGNLKESSWNHNSNIHPHHHHNHRGGTDHHRRRQNRSRSPNYNDYSSSSYASNNNLNFHHARSSPSSHVASLPTTSSTVAAARQYDEDIPEHLIREYGGDEYPPTVQELVMNGFDLQKVVKAYELIGDNFDDLLSFLMSSGN